MEAKLYTRDQFRELCLERDKHQCVFCGEKEGLSVHHIVERRLWPDGGYYLENGATVCDVHHMLCEQTNISVEDVRHQCGITKIILPPHMYDDTSYDKWGNPVMANGQRLRGELFYDESVQKVMKQGGVLDLFTYLVKYHRTNHVAWSENIHDDDRVILDMSAFEGKRVIVTVKMDGENTTMYRDYIHARSVDSRNHPSRNWVKNFWSTICHHIDEGWRVCGENMFAEHSIHYDDLKSYFYGFSMWDERNTCLSWDDTMLYFEVMGVTPVEVLYDGIYDEQKIRALWDEKEWANCEGWVMRTADSFNYGQFKSNVAKFVRKGHVQTAKHWMHGRAVIPNGLAD